MKTILKKSESLIIGLSFFWKKKGTTVAAASSFYAILTVIPLYLLIIRIFGAIVGDLEHIRNIVLGIAKDMMPNMSSDILSQIEEILMTPLTAGVSLTTFNIFIFVISVFSFLNSIWNGLYLMTGEGHFNSSWKHVKGIFIIIFSTLVMMLIILVPPAILLIINILKSSLILKSLSISSPELYNHVLQFSNFSFDIGSLVLSNIFYLLVLVLYFSFFYRWLFSSKISRKESLVASSVFVLFLLLGKNMFWIYLMYIRQGLINNYGDYYIFFIALIWIFIVMSFFYYGASICYASIQERQNDKKE